MILASAYALCFLGIQYSRFAWNPNSLPFFNILFFYSLLNLFDEKARYRWRWALAAGVSLAVSTQLHFLSFFTLPLITLIFFFFNRKELKRKLNWKIIAIFIFVVALVYVPVIANEIHSHGQATQEFVKALHSKPDNHTLLKKVIRDVRYFGQNWFTLLTGHIGKKISLAGSTLTWVFFLIPAIILNYLFWRKEENQVKKNFLLITLIWFPVYFLAYVPIAYDIRPRFFLPMLFLPFAYSGYIASFLLSQKRKVIRMPAYLLIFLIFAGNLTGTFSWFGEIKEAQIKGIYPSRTIILKSQDGIVLWHLEKAVDYMIKNCESEKIYYYSNSEYKGPIKYLLDLRGKESISLTNMEKGGDDCVFATYLTRAKKLKLPKALVDKFDIKSSQKFGALSVDRLAIKEELKGQDLGLKKRKNKIVSEEDNRLYWKDILK
jgi:hypothetical protein